MKEIDRKPIWWRKSENLCGKVFFSQKLMTKSIGYDKKRWLIVKRSAKRLVVNLLFGLAVLFDCEPRWIQWKPKATTQLAHFLFSWWVFSISPFALSATGLWAFGFLRFYSKKRRTTIGALSIADRWRRESRSVDSSASLLWQWKSMTNVWCPLRPISSGSSSIKSPLYCREPRDSQMADAFLRQIKSEN